MEIALTAGWGAAAQWLASDPEMEAELHELRDPELQPWVEKEVLEGRRPVAGDPSVEVATTYKLPAGEISMRLDLMAVVKRVGGSIDMLVADWKFGAGQRYILPPIHEDLQMVSYGLRGLRWLGSQDHVQCRVKRVLVTDRHVDNLLITREVAEEVEPWLEEVVARVAAGPDLRTPGLHCSRCWARNACSEHASLAEPVVTALALPSSPPGPLAPLVAAEWASARRAVRERCDQMDQALVEYLDAGGQVRLEGQRLRVLRFDKDRVVIPPADVLRVLTDIAGEHGLLGLGTNKVRMVEAMKAAGLDGGQREEMLQGLRDRGHIQRGQVQKLQWVKDKETVDA
jgi:hypothetical protein